MRDLLARTVESRRLNRRAARLGHLEQRTRRVTRKHDDASAIPAASCTVRRITQRLSGIAKDVHFAKLLAGEKRDVAAIGRPERKRGALLADVNNKQRTLFQVFKRME